MSVLNPLSRDQYEEIARSNSVELRKAASRINSAWKAKILRDLINPIPIRSILEFGCGHGNVSHEMAEGWPVDFYVGIDISGQQLLNALDQWPGGHFILGDERTVGALTRHFDLALLADIIEHLEDPTGLLSALRRLAKHIAIKVPLERTLFNRVAAALRLKSARSRRYERHGHIHEWNLKDFLLMLSEAELKPLRWRIEKPERPILFNIPTLCIMQRKPGCKSLVNAKLYRMLWLTPFPLIRFAYCCYFGTDLFILCEGDDK